MFSIYRIGLFFPLFTIALNVPNLAYAKSTITKQLNDALQNFIFESQIREVKDNLIIEHRLGRVDPRLKVNACRTDLIVIPTSTHWLSTYSSFRFECHEPSWSITLPIRFSAYTHAWHAKRALQAQHVLKKNDIYLKKIDTLKLFTGYFDQNHSPSGLKLNRAWTQDKLLNPVRTSIPAAVKRNEKVIIRARGTHINVKSKGIALEDGVPGEQIRVRNTSSSRVIVARVKASGLVEVNL